jgi:hypothetical protein
MPIKETVSWKDIKDLCGTVLEYASYIAEHVPNLIQL